MSRSQIADSSSRMKAIMWIAWWMLLFACPVTIEIIGITN
jgi:hypothetical protein